MNKLEFGETLTKALAEGKAADFEALTGAASAGLVYSTGRGDTAGKDEVIELMKASQADGVYAKAIEWKKPESEANGLRVESVHPVTATPAGFTWDIAFNEAGEAVKITEGFVRPTAPVPPTAIELTADMVEALAKAMDNGSPTIAGYVNEQDQPSLSPRGTTQAYGHNEVALWVRSKDTGMAKAIESNPNVSIFYTAGRGKPLSGNLQFQGRARVEPDETARNIIFDASPMIEQKADPERKGAAIVVELDKVSGALMGTRYNMVRNVD